MKFPSWTCHAIESLLSTYLVTHTASRFPVGKTGTQGWTPSSPRPIGSHPRDSGIECLAFTFPLLRLADRQGYCRLQVLPTNDVIFNLYWNNHRLAWFFRCFFFYLHMSRSSKIGHNRKISAEKWNFAGCAPEWNCHVAGCAPEWDTAALRNEFKKIFSCCWCQNI